MADDFQDIVDALRSERPKLERAELEAIRRRALGPTPSRTSPAARRFTGARVASALAIALLTLALASAAAVAGLYGGGGGGGTAGKGPGGGPSPAPVPAPCLWGGAAGNRGHSCQPCPWGGGFGNWYQPCQPCPSGGAGWNQYHQCQPCPRGGAGWNQYHQCQPCPRRGAGWNQYHPCPRGTGRPPAGAPNSTPSGTHREAPQSAQVGRAAGRRRSLTKAAVRGTRHRSRRRRLGSAKTPRR
jgi:hypothetical protein